MTTSKGQQQSQTRNTEEASEDKQEETADKRDSEYVKKQGTMANT